MAKMTQAEVKAKADEWARLQKRIGRAEADRTAELNPIMAAYEKKTAPIFERHARKIDPLVEKANAIEGEVLTWLRERPKSVTIESDQAVAALFKGTKPSKNRVANVKAFLKFVKTKGEAVYGCLNVVLKDAEKLIGKTDLDKICTNPDTQVIEAKLTLK